MQVLTQHINKIGSEHKVFNQKLGVSKLMTVSEFEEANKSELPSIFSADDQTIFLQTGLRSQLRNETISECLSVWNETMLSPRQAATTLTFPMCWWKVSGENAIARLANTLARACALRTISATCHPKHIVGLIPYREDAPSHFILMVMAFVNTEDVMENRLQVGTQDSLQNGKSVRFLGNVINQIIKFMVKGELKELISTMTAPERGIIVLHEWYD